MKAIRFAALAVFVFCTALRLLSRWAEAAPDGCEKQPPCDPAQQRPDIFPWSGGNLQLYNPVTVKALAQRTINYRLLTMPGCTSGTVPSDMVRVEAEAQKVKFALVRNDQAYDLTVRVNCGSEQIRYCGSVNVFCLGRGFPYNPDVEISDIISTYYPDSRLSILLHEIMGHAVQTANEQYQACGASCGFAATPNLVDFMNTGPLSRHGFGPSELGRWERIMYPLTTCVGDPCWDSARWQFSKATCPIGDPGAIACSWAPAPAPWGTWYGPDGTALWDYCDPTWNGRHWVPDDGWFHVGDGWFSKDVPYWSYAPPC